jgi:hypothetical protein
MTITGWENLGSKFYWIPVLTILFIFGLVAYLAEKRPGKIRSKKGKERRVKKV